MAKKTWNKLVFGEMFEAWELIVLPADASPRDHIISMLSIHIEHGYDGLRAYNPAAPHRLYLVECQMKSLRK